MVRSLRAALAVAMLSLAPAVALAQDVPCTDPLGPPPRAVTQVPPWIGTFEDETVRLELAIDERGFEGTITVSGADYPARGTVQTADGAWSLAGRFVVGAREYDFTATMDGDDTLLLTSAGVTHRLEREVIPADEPAITAAREGQTWVFELDGGESELRWYVLEASSETVRYEAQVWRDPGSGTLEPVGYPSPGQFQFTFIPTNGDDVRRERLTISGAPIDCVIVEEGEETRWLAVSGDMTIFPGCVRALRGDAEALELVRIEEP